MLKERMKPFLNYRLRNMGILVLLTLSIVQGISFVGRTGVNGLYDDSNQNFMMNLEELYPEEYQNQPEIKPDEITEEEYATAEIAISIGYNYTSGLEVTVGVEAAPTEVGGSGANKEVVSLTDLPVVGSRRSNLLWNDSNHNPYVIKNLQTIYKRGRPCNLTTILAPIRDLGFSKDDLQIKTNSRHWFIEIKDTNPVPPIPEKEEDKVPCQIGWIESFNVTIGDIRYSSLLHPVFKPGWKVRTIITGRAGEIFRKVPESQEAAGEGAAITYHSHDHFEATTKLYGVAGVAGIAYYLHDLIWDDVESIKTEAEQLKQILLGFGCWEIYYMITEYDSGSYYMFDTDVEYLLGTLVSEALGTPKVVDHCFWWVAAHGKEFLGYSFLASSYTVISSYEIGEHELRDLVEDVTSRDIYLFYWMVNCYSDSFNQLWDSSSIHNDHALFWIYEGKSGPKDHLKEALEEHVTYGQCSAQWMFGDRYTGDDTFTYRNFGGGSDEDVDKLKYLYDENRGSSTGPMFQEDKMDGYEFCFVPNTAGWVPTCRTSGEPSDYVMQLSDWEAYDYNYMLEAEETANTFQRYVGFYKRVYLPSDAAGNDHIFIDLDGRAKSDWASSSITNLRVRVYSSDWQTCITDEWQVVNGGTTDSGWIEGESHIFFNVPKGEYYNILIYYSDAWNYEYDQQIFVKNIYLGNVETDDRYFTAFEYAPLDDGWSNVYEPANTLFTRDSTRSISYTYSGHHDGGSGSVYRKDRWDTPGEHFDCTLTGWVYSNHYNYYARSNIYLVYAATDNYVRLRFYKNQAFLEWKYNDGGGEYSDSQATTIQNWNQKWWQFSITIKYISGSPDVTGWVRTGNYYYPLNGLGISYFDSIFLDDGYTVLDSRVGSYGDYWYDDFEIWW